jgi:thiamine transporter
MKRETLVKTMAEVAIFSALGYVLDLVSGLYSRGIFPNGGSIGIAMLCIFFICYRRGLIAGLFTGLIIGLLQMAGGLYVSTAADTPWKVFVQIALDYWLAYPLCGFAGVMHHAFAKSQKQSQRITFLIIGCVIGGLLKFLCHFLSGLLFWPDDAWNVGSSALYSFLYNGAYVFPSMILSTVFLVVIYIRIPVLFNEPNDYEFGKRKDESTPDENK